MFDLLYEVVKSNNYSRKRTTLMKNFTLAIVNTVNEKSVYLSRAIEHFLLLKYFESLAFQNWSTTLVLVRGSVFIHLNKALTKISKISQLFHSSRFWLKQHAWVSKKEK